MEIAGTKVIKIEELTTYFFYIYKTVLKRW